MNTMHFPNAIYRKIIKDPSCRDNIYSYANILIAGLTGQQGRKRVTISKEHL